MKLISKAAMATALALGSVALLGAPAVAAKKEKGPELKLSPEVRNALGAAQKATTDKDFATAKAKLAEADAAAKEPDEKYMIAQIRIQLGTEANDPSIQAQGVKDALASGRVPADRLPQFTYFDGQFKYNAGDFAGARTSLAKAEELGYKDTNMYLLLAETNFKSNAVPAGLGYIEKAIAAEKAAGKAPPENWYGRASAMAYNAKPPLPAEVAKWTRAQVQAFPSDKNWRSALVIYRDTAKLDNQQTIDLMRLMRVTKSLAGEKDYFEYASAAFDRGIYGEAKAVIDEGKANGALTAKPNQAISDIYAQANAKIAVDKKELAQAEKEAGTSSNFRIAQGTADALMGYGEDAKAIPLYQAALTKGSTDADAINTRIGIAKTRTGDLAGAREAFAKVNPNGPRGQIVAFWQLYIEQKAGGAAAPAAQ